MTSIGGTDLSTIKIQSRSDADSKLHLEIPVSQPDTDFEVEIVVRPKSAAGKGWPPGYEKLFGCIDDETFMVHPQPPIQPPVDLE